MGLFSYYFHSTRPRTNHLLDSKIHPPSRPIRITKLRSLLLAFQLVIMIPIVLIVFWNASSSSTFVVVAATTTSTTTSTSTTATTNNTNKNLTVVVPGFGDMTRMSVLKDSLLAIKHSLEAKHYGFDCLVYVYNKENGILEQAISELHFCKVQLNLGLWTHHMKKVPPLDETSTSHVAVIMDDIDVFTHNLDTAFMLDRMEQKGYNMVSASFPRGSVHREGLHQRAECTSHETGYVDILYTLFDWNTWKCWQDNIDLEINPYGWGYDVLVGDLCNAKIGVVDDKGVAVHVTHPCEDKEGGCRKSSYDTGAARSQMEAWIAHVAANTNNHLKGYQKVGELSREAYEYRAKVLTRWKQYPFCDQKDEEEESNKLSKQKKKKKTAV